MLFSFAISLFFVVGAKDNLSLGDELQDNVVKPILETNWTLLETQRWIQGRIPRVPAMQTKEQWEKYSAELRERFLSQVVYRGEAAKWRKQKLKVEMLEAVRGGVGYRMQKLRFEVVAGMWIPAILYTPESNVGKMPVSLAVNGHDPVGKAVGYKQTRCINMAKRGMIVLNLEWFGMGQLSDIGYDHARVNQLDLCGATSLAPFYHAMQRGLDILLQQPNADPHRVAVSGLSGGGWQTIFISALDPRVTLANPVAGYSSFLTRLVHWKDLGDTEQAPCDMALVGDYTHLTTLLAPRASLLTYNAADDCCFEAGYALPPLVAAAKPVFRLYGKERNLRTHINHVPGTHNFEQENREALYQLIGDRFFPNDSEFRDSEINCEKEIRTVGDLHVSLPAGNLTFSTLSQSLAKSLPHNPAPSADAQNLSKWKSDKRILLKEIIKWADLSGRAQVRGTSKLGDYTLMKRRITIAERWTLPVVEISPENANGTVILFSDTDRSACCEQVKPLLAKNQRVVVVDLYNFGECRLPSPNSRWASFVESVGDRVIGIQTSELNALAKWAQVEYRTTPVIQPVGARAALIGLIAQAVDEKKIAVYAIPKDVLPLRAVVDQNMSVEQVAELFCYRLLEQFDNKVLQAMVEPQ